LSSASAGLNYFPDLNDQYTSNFEARGGHATGKGFSTVARRQPGGHDAPCPSRRLEKSPVIGRAISTELRDLVMTRKSRHFIRNPSTVAAGSLSSRHLITFSWNCLKLITMSDFSRCKSNRSPGSLVYSDEINDKLLKLMNDTGYSIEQVNGQRIFSSPRQNIIPPR